MKPSEVEAWIKERYGTIRFESHNSSIVAVVPVWRGTAVGIGSTRQGALCDLYRDLTMGGHDLKAETT